MSLADKQTIELKRKNSYSDFLMNFDLNPVTGNLAIAKDEEAVKESMKNLILTATGERFYHSIKGSRVRNSLFEPNSPHSIMMIGQLAREVIEMYEPRVTVHDVRIDDDRFDANSYSMTIIFSIINMIDTQDLVLSLRRVR